MEDVETGGACMSIMDTDPFRFRIGLKSNEELATIRNHPRAGKALHKYHSKQNNLITSVLKSMEEHTEEARAEEEAYRLPVKIAIFLSGVGNLSVCVLQLYGAISTVSLSLISVAIHSVFQLGGSAALYWLHQKGMRMDVNKWPVGGSRLDTIGNVLYGCLMSAANLVVIVQAVLTFISHESGQDGDKFHLPAVVAVCVSLGIKIVLFWYCRYMRENSSQVDVIWEDHRDDIIVNGFGLLTSAGGSKLAWWLDPMGGLVLSIGVMLAWATTIYSQFGLLAGRTAPHEFIQLLIYKALEFSNEIEKVDTVRAYHSGPGYFVEINIVMDANTPLWKAHDISQQLQDKVEVLPNVERAFVHVDHETTHHPEHRKYA